MPPRRMDHAAGTVWGGERGERRSDLSVQITRNKIRISWEPRTPRSVADATPRSPHTLHDATPFSGCHAQDATHSPGCPAPLRRGFRGVGSQASSEAARPKFRFPGSLSTVRGPQVSGSFSCVGCGLQLHLRGLAVVLDVHRHLLIRIRHQVVALEIIALPRCKTAQRGTNAVVGEWRRGTEREGRGKSAGARRQRLRLGGESAGRPAAARRQRGRRWPLPFPAAAAHPGGLRRC